MMVNVRLFAILRDRAGVDSVRLELAQGATIESAIAALNQRFPALNDYLRRAAFAINRDYAPPTASLHEGDELAVIPPVSGGTS